MPHIYKPEERWETGSFPSALAVGDSWFWYVNNNILGTMVNHPALDNDHRNIQLVGYNGARLKDYVGNGKYAETVNYFLRPDFARSFSEFYISGAGNDASTTVSHCATAAAASRTRPRASTRST